MKLEEKIQYLDALIAAGEDPPEGAQWGGRGIELLQNGNRIAYREYCVLEEVLAAGRDPNDPTTYGIYVHPDATGLARFRSRPG
jgi:hypothetical protein